jgi:hypothetical protein
MSFHVRHAGSPGGRALSFGTALAPHLSGDRHAVVLSIHGNGRLAESLARPLAVWREIACQPLSPQVLCWLSVSPAHHEDY